MNVAPVLLFGLLGAPPADRPPNIVLILADDLGFSDVSFCGARNHATPHLDRLAREGTVFSQAYAPSTNCAPSRAAILTGQAAPRTGVYSVLSTARGPARLRALEPVPNTRSLDPEARTVAEVLRGAGYRTASIGKWHLGDDPLDGPTEHGFEWSVAGSWIGRPATYLSPYALPALEDGPPGEHLTARLTDEAIRFLEASRDDPFFLYLSYYAVHSPIEPSDEARARVAARRPDLAEPALGYAALVDDLDRGTGRVLDALDRLGLAEDTVVVFTSDNGGDLEATTNAYLRGGKGSFHEGGLRVPFVVRWPGRVPPGRRSVIPIGLIDLYPTFAALAGASAPADHVLDGVSLVGSFTAGARPERVALHWHFPGYLEGKTGGWRTTPVGVIREGDLKLMEWFETGALELYDLANDPCERVDLAAERADDARRLHERLRAWRSEVGAPLPEPKPPGPSDAPRPHVVLVVAEKLAPADVEPSGDEEESRAGLRRLVAEGMRFARHHAGSTALAASHEVLLTGRHAGRGVVRDDRHRPGTLGNEPLPPASITVAERLGQLGYRTSCAGAWSLGSARSSGAPTRQGFRTFLGVTDLREPRDAFPEWIWRGGAAVPVIANSDGARGRADLDLYLQRTVASLSAPGLRTEPVLVTVLLPGAAAQVDAYVARLLEALDESGRAGDTLVLLTAARARDVRTLDVDALRVPLLARWPGRVAAGSTCDRLTAAADLTRTLVELAGGACGPDVDGVSLAPDLLGADDPRPPRGPLYWELGPVQVVVDGTWRLVRTRDGRGASTALFDLSPGGDPSADVAGAHEPEVRRLVQLARELRTPSRRFPSVFDDGR